MKHTPQPAYKGSLAGLKIGVDAGHGGTARYLQLPYESHGYSAYENVMHMLYETDTWLAKWLSPEEVAKVKERQKKEQERKDKAKDKKNE